jgi:hypothetical protein
MPNEDPKTVLMNDLSSVPHIIGRLGLSIAEAQKAFNLDYLNNIERLLYLAKRTLAPADANAASKVAGFADAIRSLLAATAPSRYQFTETTLSVRLDMSQSLQKESSFGLGVGYGAVTVNAAMTVGFGYDYRAAAECRTVIHAIPADTSLFQALLDRAKQLGDKSLELPPAHDFDQALIDAHERLVNKISGAELPKPK